MLDRDEGKRGQRNTRGGDMKGWGGMEIWERVVRGGLPEKVTLEQRLGGSERGHTVPILRGEHSRQRDQQLLPRP